MCLLPPTIESETYDASIVWQGALRQFMAGGVATLLQGRMEISVSKLQNPLRHWPPWPLKNVRIRSFQVGDAR